MLNYRAALETSSSSSTVARRGGSRAVNRNCGGSRGEQSEGGFCACSAAGPCLPLGFCHLSRTPWSPARQAAPGRAWEAAAPEAGQRLWLEKWVEKSCSTTGRHLPWKCMRVVKGPLWSAETEARWTRGQTALSIPKKRMWDASSLSPHPDGVSPGCSPSHPTLAFPLWHLPQKQEVSFQYFAKFYLKMLKLTSHKI